MGELDALGEGSVPSVEKSIFLIFLKTYKIFIGTSSKNENTEYIYNTESGIKECGILSQQPEL
jgi:hypothetical protein